MAINKRAHSVLRLMCVRLQNKQRKGEKGRKIEGEKERGEINNSLMGKHVWQYVQHSAF